MHVCVRCSGMREPQVLRDYASGRVAEDAGGRQFSTRCRHTRFPCPLQWHNHEDWGEDVDSLDSHYRDISESNWSGMAPQIRDYVFAQADGPRKRARDS